MKQPLSVALHLHTTSTTLTTCLLLQVTQKVSGIRQSMSITRFSLPPLREIAEGPRLAIRRLSAGEHISLSAERHILSRSGTRMFVKSVASRRICRKCLDACEGLEERMEKTKYRSYFDQCAVCQGEVVAGKREGKSPQWLVQDCENTQCVCTPRPERIGGMHVEEREYHPLFSPSMTSTTYSSMFRINNGTELQGEEQKVYLLYPFQSATKSVGELGARKPMKLHTVRCSRCNL